MVHINIGIRVFFVSSVIAIEEKREMSFCSTNDKKELFQACLTMTTGTGILLLLQVHTDTVVLRHMAILF